MLGGRWLALAVNLTLLFLEVAFAPEAKSDLTCTARRAGLFPCRSVCRLLLSSFIIFGSCFALSLSFYSELS